MKWQTAKQIVFSLVIGVGCISASPAYAEIHCEFTPYGQPICPPGTPLMVTCPLCPVIGYPRMTADPDMTAVKEAASEVRDVYTEAQKTFTTINDLQKKLMGAVGKEKDFESDKYLPAIAFPAFPSDGTRKSVEPNPLVDMTQDSGTISQQILDTHYAAAGSPVQDMLKVRADRNFMMMRQNVYAQSIAKNTETAMVGEGSAGNLTLQALGKQHQDAVKKNELLTWASTSSAALRAWYAASNRISGLLATSLSQQTAARFADGTMTIERPDQALINNSAAEGNSAQDAAAKPVVRELYDIQNTLRSADWGVNTQTKSINLFGRDVPNSSEREQQLLAYKTETRETGERFVNTVMSRAGAIEQLHNQRVEILRALNDIELADDSIECHKFAFKQLERFRQKIIPYLQMTQGAPGWGGGGGGWGWGGNSCGSGNAATGKGAFGYSAMPLSYTYEQFSKDPDFAGKSFGYPNLKTPLDLAFEAIAGVPAQYKQDAKGDWIEIPGHRGKLLQLDHTNYYDVQSRHASATIAACQVADILMSGQNAINGIENGNEAAGEARVLPPEFYPAHNYCTPKPRAINQDTCDKMTWCLEDNVRQKLAPVVVSNVGKIGSSGHRITVEEALRDIVPGTQCLLTTKSATVYVDNSGRPAFDAGPNYYSSEMAGPPAGLLGKWLQAYKIERMEAASRFGYEDGVRSFRGMEASKRDTLERIYGFTDPVTNKRVPGLIDRHNDIIKALNDADDRAKGGSGLTPLVYYDLTTPAGRAASVRVEQQQLVLLDKDIQEKMARIADYEARKNNLQPPAEAPAEIKRQWDTYVKNMEDVKASLLRQKAKLDTFRGFAAQTVDETQASKPQMDASSNACFIYIEPRVAPKGLTGNTVTLTDPDTGRTYETLEKSNETEVYQKKCIQMEPIVYDCKGKSPPNDDIVRVHPDLVDF